MHCVRPLWPILVLTLALLPLPLAAQELEAKVKAAYIFNLVKYVDWPSLPADALRICVAGSDPVGALLTELNDRTIKDRALKVQLDLPADPSACQVLYISRSETHWQQLLSQARGRSVLTVSDLADFARQGGVVGFYAEAGRIRLEINPAAAQAAQLRISAKLMELARTVP